MEATIWFDALWTEKPRERFSDHAGRNASVNAEQASKTGEGNLDQRRSRVVSSDRNIHLFHAVSGNSIRYLRKQATQKTVLRR